MFYEIIVKRQINVIQNTNGRTQGGQDNTRIRKLGTLVYQELKESDKTLFSHTDHKAIMPDEGVLLILKLCFMVCVTE